MKVEDKQYEQMYFNVRTQCNQFINKCKKLELKNSKLEVIRTNLEKFRADGIVALRKQEQTIIGLEIKRDQLLNKIKLAKQCIAYTKNYFCTNKRCQNVMCCLNNNKEVSSVSSQD